MYLVFANSSLKISISPPPEDIIEAAKNAAEEGRKELEIEKKAADAEKKRIRDEENKAKGTARKNDKEKARRKEKKVLQVLRSS
jgi:hypothetical protein